MVSSAGTKGSEPLLQHKKLFFFFYHNGGQTLDQVAQRVFAASICRDAQIPAGHVPKQAAVSEPALGTEQA